MSRDDKVAVVEVFLTCIENKDLARLPVDPDLTVQSPLIPKVSGRTAMEYVKGVSAAVKTIRVRQHIVEGDWVATLFDEETTHGSLSVFARFQVISAQIRDVSVFYDPRRITGQ